MAREIAMKAIVQVRYGSTDVLQLKDIDKPVPRDEEVLIRVYAAGVNISDWHLLRALRTPCAWCLACASRGDRYQGSM